MEFVVITNSTFRKITSLGTGRVWLQKAVRSTSQLVIATTTMFHSKSLENWQFLPLEVLVHFLAYTRSSYANEVQLVSNSNAC